MTHSRKMLVQRQLTESQISRSKYAHILNVVDNTSTTYITVKLMQYVRLT